ncbi:SIS domain-containing protein [Streptomonospora algeriensis]|uniref:SIS domain-containing protein n=1 Tax=Streptomonospora algeriensis TaxID=995084 RepID=A0ABW3BD13_9ACTN
MTASASGPSRSEAAEGALGLYPFLAAGGERDLASVMAEVRRSSAEKAEEIVELRCLLMAECGDRLAACAEAMAQHFAVGGRLFTFGNGGSSTDAAGLATAFLNPLRGRPLPALCLTGDSAVLTALSNDVSFEVVFARQIAALGRPGDIALGLSTSGGSANVGAGLEAAAQRGMLTVAMAGYSGGRLGELDCLDHLFAVPSASVHRIQEAQTTLYHVLWELVTRALEEISGPAAGTAAGTDGPGGRP